MTSKPRLAMPATMLAPSLPKPMTDTFSIILGLPRRAKAKHQRIRAKNQRSSLQATANQRVPPQSLFQRPKHFFGHCLKPRLKFIIVADIFLYHIRKDVLLPKIQDLKGFEQFSDLIMCVSKCNRT